jgi:RNA polymerase sigma factor (sigma-70 family)
VTWAFWWCRAAFQEVTPSLSSTIRVPRDAVYRVPVVHSMDAPGSATGTAMRSRIVDEGASNPLSLVALAELPERVEAALSMLKYPRDDEFVRLRFGLDGGGQRTLREVGRITGCSNERVRQRVTRAMAELAELLAGE